MTDQSPTPASEFVLVSRETLTDILGKLEGFTPPENEQDWICVGIMQALQSAMLAAAPLAEALRPFALVGNYAEATSDGVLSDDTIAFAAGVHTGPRITWGDFRRLARIAAARPTPADDAERREGRTGETLEQYADRVVAKTRRAMLDRLDDDVIGDLRDSHLIFGKACAMEAVWTAMREMGDAIAALEPRTTEARLREDVVAALANYFTDPVLRKRHERGARDKGPMRMAEAAEWNRLRSAFGVRGMMPVKNARGVIRAALRQPAGENAAASPPQSPDAEDSYRG